MCTRFAYVSQFSASVITDKNTQRSRGFGFVTYADASAAERAVMQRSMMLEGRMVEISWAMVTNRHDGATGAGAPGSFQQPHTPSQPTYGGSPSMSTPLNAARYPPPPMGGGGGDTGAYHDTSRAPAYSQSMYPSQSQPQSYASPQPVYTPQYANRPQYTNSTPQPHMQQAPYQPQSQYQPHQGGNDFAHHTQQQHHHQQPQQQQQQQQYPHQHQSAYASPSPSGAQVSTQAHGDPAAAQLAALLSALTMPSGPTHGGSGSCSSAECACWQSVTKMTLKKKNMANRREK